MSRRRNVLDWLCWLLCPVSIIIAGVLWASPVQAQPSANIIANTVQTTNTGANSVNVGCAVGSTTCTGTLNAGVVFANALGAEAGYVEIQSNVPASTTFRLYNSSGTLFWNGSAVAIGGSISGTTNTVPLFTSSNSIGNSIMTQSGTTITVANTLSATTLTGLLSTANQSNVTGLGTVTTGTWNATKIGLLYGGTNADLSGTGGTSQFLRQASVGAAITVVRPAVADLSDNSNVALLNAANTFTGGNQTVASAVAAGGLIVKVNNTQAAAASQYGGFEFDADNAGVVSVIRQYSASSGSLGFTGGALSTSGPLFMQGGGAAGIGLNATNAAGVISFYTGGSTTQRWGINAAGDFIFGGSSHIADSVGTPTLNAGFGTGATFTGTDYAFTVAIGSTANTGGAINFGHTWSTTPTCVATGDRNSLGTVTISSTTTTVSLLYTSTTPGNVYVMCRSS